MVSRTFRLAMDLGAVCSDCGGCKSDNREQTSACPGHGGIREIHVCCILIRKNHRHRADIHSPAPPWFAQILVCRSRVGLSPARTDSLQIVALQVGTTENDVCSRLVFTEKSYFCIRANPIIKLPETGQYKAVLLCYNKYDTIFT